MGNSLNRVTGVSERPQPASAPMAATAIARRPPAPLPETAPGAGLLAPAVPEPQLGDVDAGLVITEAAMCAYCFESIVSHLNGVPAVNGVPSVSPPPFANGKQ